MRHLAILLLLGAYAQPQERLTSRQVSQVAHAILVYRTLVLEDPTQVNFCNVKEFWGAKGDFIGDDETQSMNRYADAHACKRATKDAETDYRSVSLEKIIIPATLCWRILLQNVATVAFRRNMC